MNNKKVITVLVALVIIAYNFTQAQNCQWAKSAGGTNADFGHSVATDVSGNVFIIGNFSSPTITFGSTTLYNSDTTGFYNDIFIVKYDAAGNVLWAKSGVGSTSDYGKSVTTDANGNVYLSGYFNSSTITFGSLTLSNVVNTGNRTDIFIVKFDTSGNVIWAKSAGGNKDDYAISVSSDANGNVYIIGTFLSPSIIFGSTTLSNNNTFNYSDIFVVKYATNGNILWAKRAGGSQGDSGLSISIDSSGDVYITGDFYSPTITFGSTTLTNSGSNDIFIVKYESTGNVLWAKSAGGNSWDFGRCVSTDPSGNVYISGDFQSPTIIFDSETLTNNSVGYTDVFIAKYDANGNMLWAKSAGGSFSDNGYSVSTDASGNVYMTGTFYIQSITFGTTTLTNTGYSDIFLVKYDANGNVLWAKSAGGIKDDYAKNISTNLNGEVYMTGYFESHTANFGPLTISNSDTITNNSDIFIAKFDGTITGFENLSGKKEFSFSPNPTNSTIAVTIPKPINSNIIITNLTGKQVATYNLQNSTTKTIDVSHLAEGVYFVTLHSDEVVVTKKLVKRN